ncbi:hypothetical protein K1719_017807 [Acacia pycnantha]|nr:hypothetical protein K1719_017807 [Acacia pycnantha]
MGRQPAYGFMLKKLRQFWERKGKIDVFDLENDFYLVNFQNSEDYMGALTGGPWVIADAYKFLMNLGNAIGKAIRLDVHTAQRSRGKFARMCVELDLTKPLVPEFIVEGQKLCVVYESLSSLCTKCGWCGHNKDGCVNFHKKKAEGAMEVEARDNLRKAESEVSEGSDIWKTVQRARRPRAYEGAKYVHNTGSRFAVLHEESGREDNGGGMVFNAGGPEAKTMPVSGSGVKMHNVSGRQGRMSGEVAGKKENMKARKEQEGRAAQMGKKVVELRKERGFTGINNEELSNRVQDGVPSMKNISFVPRTYIRVGRMGRG